MSEQVPLDELLEFLTAAEFFDTLDVESIVPLLDLLQVQYYTAGSEIFREGDRGDSWYVIYKGHVTVSGEAPDGSERAFDQLGPQSCFGEMAVLEDQPRSATVTAMDDVVLLRFPRAPYDKRIENGDVPAFRLLHSVARVLSRRVRKMTYELRRVRSAEAPGPD